MEIYKDYELNRIANEIRDEIEEYGQLMSAMGDALRGASIKIDPSRGQQIFTQIHETPTSFANDFFSRNQRKLMQIKNHVGMHDEDYRELSEALAINIIGILLFPLNSASVASITSDFKSNLNDPEVIKMKRNISEAASILFNLYQLDISPDIKNQIDHLQSDIKKVEKRFNPSSGCFIATFIYGEYNAPEVIKLRLFRDSCLGNNSIGRFFINHYYSLSPKLVARFSDNKMFKLLSRLMLNTIIKLLNE